MARSIPPQRNTKGNGPKGQNMQSTNAGGNQGGNQGAQMRAMASPRADGNGHEHRTAKVVELIGVSSKSFESAIRNAVADASETTRGISGADVVNMTVKCDEAGRITQYKVNLKVAFGIERTRAP